MCKKIRPGLIAAVLFAGATAPVFAVDTGTVTFNGKIIEDTCNVKVNGTDQDGTVTFSDLYASDFTGDDTVGDSQAFDIALTDCDTTIKNMNIKFEGTTAAGKNEEVLETIGGAKNVGVRLEDWTSTAVKFDGSMPATASDKSVFGTGAATFSYTAKVVQVGQEAPTKGDYTTQATYSLIYR
ncbi:MAG: fimbrial protein [Kluyvera sp.]|uniref:fimbrial protein n=1 Tax=Kluyvera sp. TaxID=1538228 RepID=UPI003A8ADBE3